jgi:hypothetical protein
MRDLVVLGKSGPDDSWVVGHLDAFGTKLGPSAEAMMTVEQASLCVNLDGDQDAVFGDVGLE